MDSLFENKILTLEKNPLLINPVVKCVFKFLSVNEIKEYRIVCHEWNCVAETFLREQANIIFTSDFRPIDFIEYFSASFLPDLPFTAFHFTSDPDGWDISELLEFFNLWGRNIKSLKITALNILKNIEDTDGIKRFNINPFIDLTSNLVELKVKSHCLALDRLTTVKTLSLIDCTLIVNSTTKRLVPSKINLQNVRFHHQTGNTLPYYITVNDYFDFSKCSEIIISSSSSNSQIAFDMSRDIVKARKINFSEIRLLNWKNSNANMQRFREITPRMQVKELEIKYSTVDLSLLPNTIQKLELKRNRYTPIGSERLHLPNLKQLSVHPSPSSENSTFEAYKMIPLFQNCSNLVDVELEGASFTWQLNARGFPKSVKRLKLIRPQKFTFIDGYDDIDVDTLILDFSCSFAFVETLMSKVKPRVLARTVSLLQRTLDCWECMETADDIISFVLKNKQLEKIILGMPEGLKLTVPFEKSDFSTHVDKESVYYEFKNQIGTAITKISFKTTFISVRNN